MNHIWTQSFKHMYKTKVYFSQRGDKWDEIARGQFKKITELLTSRAGSSKQTKAGTAFT